MVWRRLRTLHADERGLKTLEVVGLVAAAAIILLVIKLIWSRVYAWYVGSAAGLDDGWGVPEAEGGP